MADTAPTFDPSQPFEVQGDKAAPVFDANKPFQTQPAAQPKDKGGIGANLRAGFTEGLTSLPDMVMAPAIGVVNKLKGFLPENEAPEGSTAYALGAGRKNGPDINPQGVGHTLNRGLGLIGMNPEDVTAESPGERVARVAGMGASAALAPEGGAERLLTEGIPTAANVTSRAANIPLTTAARKAATGVAAGTGAGVAGEAVPEGHPALKLAVQAAAGILTGAAPEALGAVADRAVPAIARFGRPMSQSGQAQTAADLIRGRAQNPENLLESLDQNPHLVPNSPATSGQVTGDMGVLSLEREQAAKNPDRFMQVRTDQNAARRAALSGIQADANPGDVGDFLRGQFRRFDDQAQSHIDAMTAHAQHQAEQVGGAGLAEQHGVGIRDALQQAETTARARERSLWKSVDPDNNIRIDAAPTFKAADDIRGGMSRFAAPMEADEKGIFESLTGDKQLSLGELSDLRSRVSTAARQELTQKGNSPAYARLIRLRGAIQNNLADAASGKAAEDAANVSRGTMADADTISSKIEAWKNEFYGNRAAQSGAASGEGLGGSAASGPASAAGAHGAGFSEAGGPASGEGDTGMAPRPINEVDAGTLAEATKATKERAATFGQGPVKQTLAKAGTQDVYKLPEAKVPDKFFHAGPTSPSDIRQLRTVIGDDRANQLMGDYAAASFRRAAENPDGTIDPRRAASWRRKFAGPMGEFPELDQRFSTAAGATEAIADSAASHRAALADRNATALAKVANATTPEDVTRTIGGIFGSKNSVQGMAELARATASNPEARQGLRQAVANHIAQNFISNTEAGTSGLGLLKSDQFQTFLTKNRAALGHVFSPEEMGSLDAIAADLKRANRSITAVKLPGGSNTAQDTHGIMAHDPNASVLDRTLSEAGAAVAGAKVAGMPGAGVAWLGAKVANAFRGAGMKKVDDLITDALLDPVQMRNLLRRAPARPDSAVAQPIAARMRRVALGTAQSLHGQSRP